MSTDNRATRSLDRNRAGRRGETSVKRGERGQAVPAEPADEAARPHAG